VRLFDYNQAIVIVHKLTKCNLFNRKPFKI